MAKLPMVQRLVVLAAFQATVAIAYFSIIEVCSFRFNFGCFRRGGFFVLVLVYVLREAGLGSPQPQAI